MTLKPFIKSVLYEQYDNTGDLHLIWSSQPLTEHSSLHVLFSQHEPYFGGFELASSELKILCNLSM